MGTDNNEQTLFCIVEGGTPVPVFKIENVDFSAELAPAADQCDFDCSSFSVSITAHLSNELVGCLAMIHRLYGMGPMPKKLSRKRFVKWLMAIKVPRNYAQAAAAAGVSACGSYAAAWRDLVEQCIKRDGVIG